jgi:preprotein translocase subunit SecF
MSRREVDFTSKRKMFIIISVVLVLVALISIFTKGFNFGVDFAGGTDLVFSSTEDLTVSELREKLSDIEEGFEMAQISKLNDIQSDETIKSNFSVKVIEFYKSEDKDALLEKLPSDLKVESFDAVSGFAADELRSKSTWIAIIALAIILVYVTFRFKFSFGVGAIIALAHDAVITLGLYSLFGIPFDVSVIAAILTLLGYSLNDTIVVYDRIRENLKKSRKNTMEKTINDSINQVLSRTINTSLTTFIVVFTMLLFGGAGLRPFAFGMTVGVIVGTYSSIFIASPILIGMFDRKKK